MLIAFGYTVTVDPKIITLTQQVVLRYILRQIDIFRYFAL